MAQEHRPVRRLKTYTAQTGLVYQYVFVGKRRALPHEPAATEYIFDVSPDRKLKYSVSVFILDDATAAWAEAHGRRLLDAEEYAAAKMRLLAGFDDIEDMLEQGRRLLADSRALEELLAGLGLE
jgi:hypothetical protein